MEEVRKTLGGKPPFKGMYLLLAMPFWQGTLRKRDGPGWEGSEREEGNSIGGEEKKERYTQEGTP